MSPADAHTAALGRTYGPTAAEQANAMSELGEGLMAQLVTLSMDPTPFRCEQMAANLEGAKRAVLRLRERLQSEDADSDGHQ